MRRAVVLAALSALGALAGCQPSELVAAIDRGDGARARTLLRSGASPDGEDDNGDSALMLAVWHGDADLVKAVLARHPDVRHANDAGATALHFAVDDATKTELLLVAGADPGAEDRRGITPLQLAAGRDDNAAVVDALLAHGADAKRVDGSIGASSAAAASRLLAHGTDPRAASALAVAASRGNVAVMRLLLDRGADVDQRTELGMTPLMWAAQMGGLWAVALLLARGANPNLVETFNQSTALMQAAASDRADASIVRALLEAHADVAPLAQQLVATQRPDGGFAQRAGLRSDPYATGQAIVALRTAGVAAGDPAIRRAVHFLVAHQITDGSWFVATRALRFQPFFDSGFPQGRSQYASALATSWAVMALADALE